MKKPTLAVAAIAIVIALAGCGSDDSDELSGPASVMPAESPIYFEFAIRPQGEQAENLDALLAELGEIPLLGSVGDPGDLLIDRLEAEAASAGVDFSYAEDIEPWLGESAGFSVYPSETGEDLFVAAVETTDEEQARESIDGLVAQGPVEYTEEEYEGVSYQTAPSDAFSFGVFDGHVVFATTDQFEAAVDASADESLAESDKLTEALGSLDDERLGALFVDLGQFEEFASTPEDAEEFEQIQAAVPELFDSGIAISAGVSAADQVYIDYSTPLIEGIPESGASPLLEGSPGDSLGAFAIEDIGAYGPPIVDLFEQAQEEGADIEDFPAEGIEQAFEDETGVVFDDAAEAIGDASLWVRGDLPDGLEVAGEIEVSDEETATELIEALEEQARTDGSVEIGPPVGGSDVGFSALDEGPSAVDIEPGPGQDPLEFDPESGGFEEIPAPGADSGSEELPFVNIELDGDTIRYGFFRDEAAAQASDPEGAGAFSETEVFAAGEEAVGDDFEYLGAVDLEPILDEFVPSPGIGDAILGGGSPEELIGPFIAGKLGVVAFGQRYEDDFAVSRYVLKLDG